MYRRSHGEPGGETCSGRAAEPSAAGLFVRRVTLTNFRNYPSLRLELPERAGLVVLTGPNGSGKTNLMEAVSFLAPGKGIRNARFADVTRRTEEAGVAAFPWAVAAVLHNGAEEIEIGTGCEAVPGGRSRTDRRAIRLNGEPRKSQADLGSVCSAVWLTPAMDRLFSGDPSGRRRFWDRLTQAFFPAHAGHCAAYAQSLRQWGLLLREGKRDDAWLSALENTLGRYGSKIAAARRETLERLRSRLDQASDSFPRAGLELTGGMEDVLAGMEPAEAEACIRERFRTSRKIYVEGGAAGGVHTVDLSAVHREKRIPAALCSTGEQKALLISILLSHVRAQAERTGTLPLLLLDEVSAHLDAGRREALFAEIAALGTQVWMTGTEEKLFEGLKETAHVVAVDTLSREPSVLAAAS